MPSTTRNLIAGVDVELRFAAEGPHYTPRASAALSNARTLVVPTAITLLPFALVS